MQEFISCLRAMQYKKWLFLLVLFVGQFKYLNAQPQRDRYYSKQHGWLPWVELEHHREQYTTAPPKYLNRTGYTVPPSYETPDFRLPEPPWYAQKKWFYAESDRPYRMSPAQVRWSTWNKVRYWEHMERSQCICCTVFKRLTPLSTCMVITTRHILTTATATELVLQRYRNYFTVQNILGVWYEVSGNYLNVSHYATPARIHYHPQYFKPNRANRSHPIPAVHDLAVWALTFRVMRGSNGNLETFLCMRPQTKFGFSSLPNLNELLFIGGYQFVWAYNKLPSPFQKYLIRTRFWGIQCPKVEWGWFICMHGSQNAKFGFDSGATLFISYEDMSWKTDGYIGMNAFSMKLRSLQILHYFTVLNTHSNLNFLYAAYMGRLPYEYLDKRFHNTQWRAPMVKRGYYVQYRYVVPWQPAELSKNDRIRDLWY